MGLKPLTSSTAAVTLAEAKLHLRIEPDFTGHDATLTTFALAATQWVENETRQQLVSRDFLLTLDSFPACGVIKLPRVPLASVASVQYRDAAGALQTLATSAYTVDDVTRPGRIVLALGSSWPTTSAMANAVEVRFTTGYGTAVDVPQILKQCVLLMLGSMFENREGAIDRRIDVVPLAVESIVSQHQFVEAV